MNIHELNTKAITNPAWVGLDDGEDTYKLDLNATLSTMQSSISGAESNISTAQANITQLQTDVAQAQATANHADDGVDDLQSDLSSLDTRTTASLNNLQSEVDAVEEDVTDLKSGLEQYEDIFTGNVDESVKNWLDEHPEATTSVEDGSLTYKKLVNGTLGFVTPQMYGAKGDGVTDDTEAIQRAINSGFDVYFPPAVYISTTLIINNSNLTIDGGGATINFGSSSGFFITKSTHDIKICNLNSICTYTKDSQATTNVHIGIQGDTTDEYYAYNIIIQNCNFSGGVMGISASSVKNVSILDCTFDGMVYKPEDAAGGYGVLLQSCVNININRCNFNSGKYGRHDIYISVDGTKSANKQCKNININGCAFNHSDLELDANNHYYSDVTVPINIRTSKKVSVSNCYFYSTVGIASLFNENGDITGTFIENCVLDTPVFNDGTSESKYAINVLNGGYYVTAVFDNIILQNVPNDYQNFILLNGCNVKILNCDISTTRILINNNVTVQIENITSAITYYFIRFNAANSVTKGYCRNITFTQNLIGAKYYYATGASVSDGFFVRDFTSKSFNNATYCYRNTDVARIGDIVQCNIGILKDLPSREFVTLFTLDEEYKPRMPVYFVLITRDNNKSLIQGVIDASGNVQVYNVNGATSGNLNVTETISFIGVN